MVLRVSQQKTIDGISTRAAKRLKWISSNDRDFLEQSRKYSVYLNVCNHNPKEIIRAFEKNSNQPRWTVQQKAEKSKIDLVMFTTQYNPLGLNIKSAIKNHIPIITGNPNLVEIFPPGFDIMCI